MRELKCLYTDTEQETLLAISLHSFVVLLVSNFLVSIVTPASYPFDLC